MSKGRHILTFVCTGKDSRSFGYNFGLNDVVLEKMPEGEDEAGSSPLEDEGAVAAQSKGPVYRGRALSYYLGKLKTASGEEQMRLLRAVGEFGKDGNAAIPLLNATLGDASAEVRAAAVSSLAKIGAGSVPALITALKDENAEVRGLAALALKSIGPDAAPAVGALAAALSDTVESVRIGAADALGAIGPRASAAVPALAARLADKSEGRFVFRSSLQSLGKIGPGAKAALPQLEEIAKQTGRDNSVAAQTIRLIEGKEVATYY